MLVVLLAEGTLIPGGVGARMKVVVVGNWRGSKQQEGPTADQVTCPDLGDLPNNTSYSSTNTSSEFCDLPLTKLPHLPVLVYVLVLVLLLSTRIAFNNPRNMYIIHMKF